jgi:hypothetical protein
MSASRTFLSLFAVLTLQAASIQAQPLEIPGEETTLKGSTEGIISHRYQKHSWITPDGRFQALINTGPNRNALQLFSSEDGIAWTLQAKIADTDRSSHPDGTLVGNRLFVAYPTRQKKVALAIYDYAPASKNWTLVRRVAVPADKRTDYERPSVAIDGTGRIWISAIALQAREKFICVYVIEGETQPRRVNLEFGLRNRNHQRSARLLQVPNGIMMVYSDDPFADTGEYTLNFCQRSDAQAVDAAWTASQKILDYHNEPDDNGAHFSCAVDGSGATHIVTRAFPDMYYLRIENGSLVAGTPRNLGLTGSTQYPQVSIAQDESVHLFCAVEENGKEPIRVLSSRDGGDSFTNDFDLMFMPNDSLGGRRLEAPEKFFDELPVLMLYKPSRNQRNLAGFLFTN